eukprot:gene6547-960_t
MAAEERDQFTDSESEESYAAEEEHAFQREQYLFVSGEAERNALIILRRGEVRRPPRR